MKNRRIIKRILAGMLIVSMGMSVAPVSVYAEDKFNFESMSGIEKTAMDFFDGEKSAPEFIMNVSEKKIDITDSEKGAFFYLTISPEEEIATTLQVTVEDESVIQVKQILQEELPEDILSKELPDNAHWFHIDWISNGNTKIKLKWHEIEKEIQVNTNVIDESKETDETDSLDVEIEEEQKITDTMAVPTPGWMEQGGKKYYINVDGTKAKGFSLIENVLYYFDESTGVLRQYAGWIEKGENKYFCNEEGVVYRNMFIKFDTTYYYMGDDGAVQKGIVNVEGKLYYADPSSGVVKKNSGWIEYNGKSYFAAEDGILYAKRFIKFGETYYYMGVDGSLQKGLFYIDGDLYYSDPISGVAKITEGWIEYDDKTYYSQPGGMLYIGMFVKIDDKNYCFANDASLYKGTFIFDGKKYHANSRTGEIKLQAGWIEDAGKKYYSTVDGSIYYNQFIKFGDTYYYMGEDGSVQVGIVDAGENLYYADPETGIIQKKAGWITYKGKRYYSNSDGILYRNQLITFGDIWYYMGNDGSAQSGIVDINGNLYYAAVENGIIQKNVGWIEFSGKQYFAKENGVLYRNQMIKFGTIYYYMGNDGSVQKGVVQTTNGVYYADPNTGVIQTLKEGWLEKDGKKYFVGPAGKLYSNQIITFGDIWYYMGPDGSVQKGIIHAVGDVIYYADPDTGIIQKKVGWIEYENERYFADETGKLYHNQIITFGDIWYYMGADGSVKKGIVHAAGGVIYFADSKTGVIWNKVGWIEDNGNKYFADETGKLYHNQLITFGTVWYYMGADGAVKKGIIDINGTLYYADVNTGIIKKNAGWIDYAGKRYFANESGILYRNQFITFGSDTYYMDSTGSMVKGKKYINGVWYTFNEKTGLLERKAGWFTSGSNKYYQKADGTLAKGYTDIDGVRYYFDSTGALASKMGIDVSQWQGNINWSEVKKAGVEFAMIRVGYRGSAAAGKLMADPYYKQNIEGALAAGIKVGVYFFSQAITVQEAKEEAQFTYNLIKDYNITYPVAFDSEYYNSDRDGRADYLSATQRTLMANTFCIEMQRLGYKPMVYASTSFFQTDLQLSMLTKWQLWVAQYNTVITHKGSYQCWQYTSTGKVNGIHGNVDMNVWIN